MDFDALNYITALDSKIGCLEANVMNLSARVKLLEATGSISGGTMASDMSDHLPMSGPVHAAESRRASMERLRG